MKKIFVYLLIRIGILVLSIWGLLVIFNKTDELNHHSGDVNLGPLLRIIVLFFCFGIAFFAEMIYYWIWENKSLVLFVTALVFIFLSFVFFSRIFSFTN